MNKRWEHYLGLFLLLLTFGIPFIDQEWLESLSINSSYISWAYLGIMVISSAFIYRFFFQNFFPKSGILIRTLLLLTFYGGLLGFLKLLQYEDLLAHDAVISQLSNQKIGLFSSLEWLFGSTLLLIIILNYRQGQSLWTKKPFWLPILVYSFISISIWLLAWVMRILFFESPVPFNFRNTFSPNISVIINLLSAVVLILSHYFGVQHIIRYMHRQNIPLRYRLIGIAAGVVFGFLFILILPISISPIIALPVMLVFLPLWDIYMDSRTNNLSWTLFLLLPYSIFPGLIFIKYFQQAVIKQGGQLAPILVQNRDPLTEETLNILVPEFESRLFENLKSQQSISPPFWKNISEELLSKVHLRKNYQLELDSIQNISNVKSKQQIFESNLVDSKMGYGFFPSEDLSQTQYFIQYNQQVLRLIPREEYQVFDNFSDPGDLSFNGITFIRGTPQLLEDLDKWKSVSLANSTSNELSYKIQSNEIKIFYRTENGRNIILSKSLFGLIEPIAISSLFFILLLSSLFVIHFFSRFGIVKEGFTIFAIDYDSLSTRIQSGTVGIILISFILIGLVSINFLQTNPRPEINIDLGPKLESAISTLNLKIAPDTDTSFISFLRSLVSAYAFLLSIAIVMAIFITNSITRPLTSIGDKLSTLSLEKNQPLEWYSQDEIGRLVNIYNQMIEKLAQQAQQLKKSEREDAWREMAKQVAHEIKNPLTPMKLNVQYLLRAKDQQDPQAMKDLLKRSSKTLIEQIDSLSRIATEFSNFAKMPKAQLSIFSLNELLHIIYNLHQNELNDSLSIQLNTPEENISIEADKEQLMRVLTNLVKNGMQAIPEERKGCILISLSKKENVALISVKDNGTGIPKNLQDKVFVPNFTTKSSGTGLGLAISRNIIQHINGKIYFETEEGKGTTFYLELPLLN